MEMGLCGAHTDRAAMRAPLAGAAQLGWIGPWFLPLRSLKKTAPRFLFYMGSSQQQHGCTSQGCNMMEFSSLLTHLGTAAGRLL